MEWCVVTKKEGFDGAIFVDKVPQQVHILWEVSQEPYPSGNTDTLSAELDRVLPN